jgi:DNA repair protein MmcB-like
VGLRHDHICNRLWLHNFACGGSCNYSADHLVRLRQIPIPMIKHDQLAELTASWLRVMKSRMTWTNFRYDIYGTGRPDVFSIAKSLHLKKCSPMVHEIKVSRADFFSDVKSDKWRKYQAFCSHFYFVCPNGMVDKSEVPKDAGLIFYDDTAVRYNRFTITKCPRVNKEWVFEDEFIMRLIIGRWGTEPSQFLNFTNQQEGKT